jgi:hypothetical protein
MIVSGVSGNQTSTDPTENGALDRAAWERAVSNPGDQSWAPSPGAPSQGAGRARTSNAGGAGSPAVKSNFVLLADNGSSVPGPLQYRPGPVGTAAAQLPPPSWVDYGPQWTQLTNGTSSDQSSEVASLRAPLDAAQTLDMNWDKYDLGSIDWKNPPSTLPADVRNALQLVEQNPALLNAMTGGSSGPVTETSFGSFIGNAQQSLSQAAKDYQAWQKANPNAGPMASSLAQSAAILEANGGLLPGNYSASDLQNLASQNPGLSPSLAGAAKLWAQPGTLYNLDTAGDPVTASPDGLVNGGNISAWLTKGSAPGTDNDAMDFINSAALRSATNGVDTSNLNSDIFANPSNYKGPQKAAALQQLLDMQNQLAATNNAGYIDYSQLQANGINPNLWKTTGDLQSKIATLQNDPDVQSFLSTTKPAAVQAIVNANPDLNAAVSAASQKFQSGATLNDDLNAKDSNGNPLPQPAALDMFTSQAGFFQSATGAQLDLTSIAKKSPSYQQVLDYFNSNIVSGNDFNQLASTAGPSGVTVFNAELQNYQSVLDPSDVDPNIATTMLNNINNKLFANLTFANLDSLIGDGQGNVDQAKLKTLADQMITASGGDPSDPKNAAIDATLWTALKDFWGALKSGVQATSALSDVMTKYFPKTAVGVQNGWAHGINLVLSALALGFSTKAKPPQNAIQWASFISSSAGILGQFVNTAGRFFNAYKSAPPALNSYNTAQAALTQAETQLNGAIANQKTAESSLDDARNKQVDAKREFNEAYGNFQDIQGDLQTAHKNGAENQITQLSGRLDEAKVKLRTARAGLRGANAALEAFQSNLTQRDNIVTQQLTAVAVAKDSRDAAWAKYASIVPTSAAQLAHSDGIRPETRPPLNRGPALGESVSGVAGLVTGGIGLFSALQNPTGDAVQDTINKVNAGFNLAGGAADTAEGFTLLLSGGAVPDLVTKVLSAVDGFVGVAANVALFVTSIISTVHQIEEDKAAADSNTTAMSNMLTKYGISGGPVTVQDRMNPGFAGLTPPPPDLTKPGAGVARNVY